MAILVTCSNCQSELRVPDEMAGRTGRCKKCNATITVPSSKVSSASTAKSAAVTTKTPPSSVATPSGNRLVPLSKRGKFDAANESVDEARAARDRRNAARQEYEEPEEVAEYEEEDRPKPKKRKKKQANSSSNLLLIFKVGLVVVGAIIGFVRAANKDDKPNNPPPQFVNNNPFPQNHFVPEVPPFAPHNFGPQGSPFGAPATKPQEKPRPDAPNGEKVLISNARWEVGFAGQREIVIDFQLTKNTRSLIGTTLVIKGTDNNVITSDLTSMMTRDSSGSWRIRVIGAGAARAIGPCEISVEEGGFYSPFNSRPGNKVSNVLASSL